MTQLVDDTVLIRAARRIHAFLPEVLEGVGAVGLAVTQFITDQAIEVGKFKADWSIVLLVVASLLFVWGLILGAVRRRQRGELEKDLGEAKGRAAASARRQKEAEAALETALMAEVVSFYRRHGLGPDDRVSVYAFNGVELFQLARYSENPELNVPGRDRYDCDVGFLGDAWMKGYVYASTLPDPNTHEQVWRQRQQETGLVDEVIDDLTMRSRAYLGKALKDPSKTENVGVLMLESLNAQGLSTLKDQLDDDDIVSLGVLIMLTRPREESSIGVAMRGGF